MDHRLLGRTGVSVSKMCLGAMMFGSWGNPDHDESIRIIHAALDAGINFLDTADVYGAGESEEIVGKALKGRRDDVILATKFHGAMGEAPNQQGSSRRWIIREVENSLRRLQTDWIDLYQYHRPDGITPIEETLGALEELVYEGKVRFIGSSNLDARQIVEADDVAKDRGWPRFVSAQNEYSFLQRAAEEELLPTAERLGIGVLPYFPLASGLLTGKYRRGQPAPAGTRLALRPERLTDDAFDKVEALESYAQSHGVSLLEVAIGGLAAQPAIASVIAGATKPEQVRANAAAGDWIPGEDDLRELREVLDA
jgi:aryl-alcohol dehydrogenase-like predicted oxidoreductase